MRDATQQKTRAATTKNKHTNDRSVGRKGAPEGEGGGGSHYPACRDHKTIDLESLQSRYEARMGIWGGLLFEPRLMSVLSYPPPDPVGGTGGRVMFSLQRREGEGYCSYSVFTPSTPLRSNVSVDIDGSSLAIVASFFAIPLSKNEQSRVSLHLQNSLHVDTLVYHDVVNPLPDETVTLDHDTEVFH